MNISQVAGQTVEELTNFVNTERDKLRKETDLHEVKRYVGVVLNLVAMIWVFLLASLPVTLFLGGGGYSAYPGAITVGAMLCSVFLRGQLDEVPTPVQVHNDFLSFRTSVRWICFVSVVAGIVIFPLMMSGKILVAGICYGVFIGIAFANSVATMIFRRRVIRKLEQQ